MINNNGVVRGAQYYTQRVSEILNSHIPTTSHTNILYSMA